MANYIAWHGKKRERLANCEQDFRRLLREHPGDQKRIEEGIEVVRQAQIRALKARRAQLKPSEVNTDAVARLDCVASDVCRENCCRAWLVRLPLLMELQRRRG